MLNGMRMAQVTDNPAMADGSSIHQQAKRQLKQYIRTNIQPLMRAGKPASLQDALHYVTMRRPKMVQHIGKQKLLKMLQDMIGFRQ